MKLSFLLLLAAVILPQLATSDPSPSVTSTEAPQASTLAVRYLYNAGSNKQYELANEQFAWDDANSLAIAADKWSAGRTWQPISDYFGTKWCGQDFAKTEIKTALTNAINVHSPGIPIFRSRLFVYLHETGNYDPPYNREIRCGDLTAAYSSLAEGVVWNDYYVTGGNDQTGNSTLFYSTTRHVYLHELHHFGSLVSPRPVGTYDVEYTARGVHGLANAIGYAPSYDLRVTSSLNNAHNYATFSDAAYWSEQFEMKPEDFPKRNITADAATADTVSTFPAAAPAISPFNGTIPSGLPADPNKPDSPAPADATVTMKASNSSATTASSSKSVTPSSSPSCTPRDAPQVDVQAAIHALKGHLRGGPGTGCSQAATSGVAAIEVCGGSTNLCLGFNRGGLCNFDSQCVQPQWLDWGIASSE